MASLLISWGNMRRIYPDEAVSFWETASLGYLTGFLSVPLSFQHLLSGMGGGEVIPVGGRPGLLIGGLIFNVILVVLTLVFIVKGEKWSGLIAIALMLLSAPYWGYYSHGLIGI